MIVWLVSTGKTVPDLETAEQKEESSGPQKKEGFSKTWKVFCTSGIIWMLLPSFIRTMMDMGLKSWVPTMITECYAGITPSFANMITTILLIINIFGVYIVKLVYPKRIKSEALCFALCFVISIPFTLLLLLTGKISVYAVVLFLTLVTTFMYSGHQIINVIIPSKFSPINLSGGVASLLNGVGSLGAVAANFGYGFLADKFGWTATIMSWNIMAILAALFALLSVKAWNRFTKTI